MINYLLIIAILLMAAFGVGFLWGRIFTIKGFRSFLRSKPHLFAHEIDNIIEGGEVI